MLSRPYPFRIEMGRQFPVPEVIVHQMIEEEKENMKFRAICPIMRAFDSHFTKEFNEFRNV
jgi:hypothetical protein